MASRDEHAEHIVISENIESNEIAVENAESEESPAAFAEGNETEISSLPDEGEQQSKTTADAGNEEDSPELDFSPLELDSYLDILVQGAVGDENALIYKDMGLINGLDRLGTVSSSGEELSSGPTTFFTTGLTPYADDAGQLIPGVLRLPDQPSSGYQWDNSYNNVLQNNDAIAENIGGVKENPRQYVVFTGQAVNESSAFITFTLESNLVAGNGRLSFAISDDTAVQQVNYLPNLEWFDGIGWQSLAPIAPGLNEFSVAVANGHNELQFRLPLVDNHLTHSDKQLEITITGYTLDSGLQIPLQELTDAPTTKLVIIDDNTSALKDGPVVSIESSMLAGEGTLEGETHTFTLSLRDKVDTSLAYAGDTALAGDNLPQDLTVTLQLSGSALLDSDYTCAPSSALQALITAGKVTDFFIDPNGATITLTLKGMYDASGKAHPAGTPCLKLTDIAEISLDFALTSSPNFVQPERDIQIEVANVVGNEAFAGAGASTTINEDPEGFRGPQLSLNTPVAKEGFGTATHIIELKAPPYANMVTDGKNPGDSFPADEDIRISIKLAGQNGAVLGDINSLREEADFALDTQSIKYFDDSTNAWEALPVSNYSYNSSTGELALTIPAGAQKISFDVAVMDDKREGEDAESYDVTLGLVYENGVPDALATIADVNIGEKYTQNISIVEESRTDAGVADLLNPPHFDGPHLWFTSDAETVLEGEKVQYTLKLTNPASATPSIHDTVYAADEDVTITLKVSFSSGPGFQPHDLVFYDSNHNPVVLGSTSELAAHTGPLFIKTAANTFTEINISAAGDSFTFSQVIAAGKSQSSFELEVRDDAFGGVKETDHALPSSDNDLQRETIAIDIVDLSGNETRYDGAHADNSHTATILDDGSFGVHQGGDLDGPQVSIAFGSTEDFISSSGSTAVVREDKSISVKFTAEGQTGSAILEEPLHLLVRISGPDQSFILKYADGEQIRPVAGSPENYLITIPQGTDLSDGYTVILNADDSGINTDDRNFSIAIKDIAGCEATTTGGTLDVTIKEAFTPANGSLTLIDKSGATIDKISESDQSKDTWTSTADNLMHAKVDIKSSGGVGSKLHFADDVTFTLSMKPAASAPANSVAPRISAGTPTFTDNPTLADGDDIYWAAFKNWGLVLDGTEYSASSIDASGKLVFMVGGSPFIVYIDSSTNGQITVTVPKESIGDSLYSSVSIKVGVGIHDDLFEEVKGEFVDFDLAFSNNISSVVKPSDPLEIVADSRPDDISDQPLLMDGPFVAFTHTGIDGGNGTSGEVKEGGSVTYKIQLTDPSGNGTVYTEATEDIVVSFKISGGEGFSLGDVFKPDANGKFNETITCETIPPITPAPTISIKGNINDPEGTFTVTVPKGVGELQFALPINDDMVGGSENSPLDKPREDMTLEITKIEGSEARLDYNAGDNPQEYKDTVVIIDDSAGSYLQVGLVWNAYNGSAIDPADNSKNVINEGTTGNFGFTLTLSDGTELSDSNNPYKGYSTNSNTFPEDLTVTLNFGDGNTARGDDMHLRASTSLIELVTAGKIKVFAYNDLGERAELSSTALATTDLAGSFDLVLVGEKFEFTSDLSRLTVNAHIHGDRSNEFDKDKNYLVEKDAIEEAFGISIEKVEGNETFVHNGKGSLSGTITDVANGCLAFSDDSGSFVSTGSRDFGRWEYTVHVKYSPTEKDNSGNATAPGVVAGSQLVNVPTEDITFAIRVSDSLVFQQGEEYVVSDYSLFLSINDVAKDVISQDAYDAFLAGGAKPDGWDAGWAVVKQSGEWKSLGLADLPKASTGEFTIDVPVEYWQNHADGTINFAIDQHRNVGGKQNDIGDSFKVEIIPPQTTDDGGNLVDCDVKGEIVSIDSNPVYGGFPPSKLGLNLTGTSVIMEDNAEHIATYNMSFNYFLNRGSESEPNYQMVDDEEPFYAASTLFFTFALTPGSASFNEDTINNVDYSTMGDFAMAYEAEDGSFQVLQYSGIKGGTDNNSLEFLLNDYLQNKFGNDDEGRAMVSASIELKNNSYEFKFTVQEGVDLREGIDLHFIAMDDNFADPGESFSGKIYDVYSQNNIVHATIEKNEAKTTIYDEPSDYFSGFAIALADGHGYELKLDGNAKDSENIPFDGKVHVPVFAYILGNNAGIGKDGSILSLSALKSLFGKANIDTDDSDFQSWIADNFKPTQDIKLSYTLNDTDNAKVEIDYKFDSSATINSNNWQLVIEGDKIYYEAEFTVETINDYLDMGGTDISFGITLTGTNGNETRPARASDEGEIQEEHAVAVEGFIKDFHDGPQVSFIGRNDTDTISITEPTDYKHGPVDGAEHKVDPSLGDFTVQLSATVMQDTIVWLAVGEGTAEEGADFTFGQGMYKVISDNGVLFYETFKGDELVARPYAELADKYPYLDANPSPGSHFVIVPQGQSSVDLEIRVLDDNKNEGREDFIIAVEKVEGGEATYLVTGADGNSYKVPWSDSMPFKFSVLYSATEGGTPVPTSVIVDPASQTVLDMSGNILSGFDWGAPGLESWYPFPYSVDSVDSDKLESTIEIEDDGFGPIVSIDIDETEWAAGDAAPSFTLRLEDYCQDDVSVDVRIEFLDGSHYTFSLSIPEGSIEKTFDSAAVYQAVVDAYGAEAPDSLPRGSFYVTTPSSQGGETQPSEAEHFYPVPVEDYPDHVYIWNFRPVVVEEGVIPGQPGEKCSFAINLYIPPIEQLSDIQGGGSFTIKIPDSARLSGGGKIEVSFTEAQLKALQYSEDPSAHFPGKQYAIVVTDDGAGNLTAKIHDWAYERDENGNVIDGPGTIGAEVTTAETKPTVSTTPSPSGKEGLPGALGDTVLGNEETLTVNVDVGGSIHYTPSQPSKGYITITDKTSAKVVFAVYNAETGEWQLVDESHFSESAGSLALKAFLALINTDGDFIDADGNKITAPLTLDDLTGVSATKELTFDIAYTPVGTAGAILNQDFTGDTTLSIKAGQSSGAFNIVITDDDFSEPEESFTISLTPTVDTANSSAEILGKIAGNVDGSFGSGTLFIEDNLSGPDISWAVNQTSVAENGTIILTIESHQGGSRQVVSEDVELTFILQPKDGFSVEEIKSISYNAKTYSWTGSAGSNLSELMSSNGDGTWTMTLPAGMPGAKGLNDISITLQDDVITEGNESFSLELTGVYGGETSNAVPNHVKDFTVTDTLDGPTLSLVAGSGSEEHRILGQGKDESGAEIEAAGKFVDYKVTLSGGQPTGEAAVIKLTVTPDAAQHVDKDGSFFIKLPGSDEYLRVPASESPVTPHYYDTVNKQLVITLPEGSRGGTDICVYIPIKDNSTVGNRDFGLTMEHDGYGEISSSDGFSYSASFVAETSPTPNNGGAHTYKIYTSDAAVSETTASLSITVNGIYQPAGSNTIKTITLGGKTLVEGTDWEWNANGESIEISIPKGPLPKESELFIEYDKNADKTALEKTKSNISIGAISIGGREVTTVIKDESTSGNAADGPLVSIDLDGNINEIVEGNDITGNIKITLPVLPGDAPQTAEDLFITIKLGSTAEIQDAFVASLEDHQLYMVEDQPGGIVILGITAGTDLALNSEGNYELSIPFTVPVPDTPLDNKGSISFEVTRVEGSNTGTVHYEVITADTAKHEVAVKPNDATLSGPSATLALEATSVEEGGLFKGKLTVDIPKVSDAVTTTQEVTTIKLALSEGIDWSSFEHTAGADFSVSVNQQNGEVSVTIPAGKSIPGGGFELNFTAQTKENSVAGPNPAAVVEVKEITGSKGLYEQYSGADTSQQIEVTDSPSDAGQGPEASLIITSEITNGELPEGSSLEGKVSVKLPVLAGDSDKILEDITITLSLSPKERLDDLEFEGVTDLQPDHSTGEVKLTIPAGTTLTQSGNEYTYDIGFSLPIADTALADKDKIEFKITDIRGDSGSRLHYEKMGVDTSNAGSGEIQVVPTDTPDQVVVEISADTTMLTETNLAFGGKISIELPHGGNAPTAVPAAIVIVLAVSGLEEFTISGVSGLDANFYDVDTSELISSEKVTLTIREGAPVPDAAGEEGLISFDYSVTLPESSVAGDSCELSVDSVTGTYEALVAGSNNSIVAEVSEPVITPFLLMPAEHNNFFAMPVEAGDGDGEAGLFSLPYDPMPSKFAHTDNAFAENTEAQNMGENESLTGFYIAEPENVFTLPNISEILQFDENELETLLCFNDEACNDVAEGTDSSELWQSQEAIWECMSASSADNTIISCADPVPQHTQVYEPHEAGEESFRFFLTTEFG